MMKDGEELNSTARPASGEKEERPFMEEDTEDPLANGPPAANDAAIIEGVAPTGNQDAPKTPNKLSALVTTHGDSVHAPASPTGPVTPDRIEPSKMLMQFSKSPGESTAASSIDPDDLKDMEAQARFEAARSDSGSGWYSNGKKKCYIFLAVVVVIVTAAVVLSFADKGGAVGKKASSTEEVGGGAGPADTPGGDVDNFSPTPMPEEVGGGAEPTDSPGGVSFAPTSAPTPPPSGPQGACSDLGEECGEQVGGFPCCGNEYYMLVCSMENYGICVEEIDDGPIDTSMSMNYTGANATARLLRKRYKTKNMKGKKKRKERKLDRLLAAKDKRNGGGKLTPGKNEGIAAAEKVAEWAALLQDQMID